MMVVVVNYRKAQKLDKKCSTSKSTVARPPIYDRAQPEMLSTASPGNPVSIMKPSSLLLFMQPEEKFLEEWTKVKETHLLTIFGKKQMEKNRSQSKLASKLIAIHTV